MYKINRYPKTSDRSLRVHSAADEYLLQHLTELKKKGKNISIYNDRFGYLAVHLSEYKPTIVIGQASQAKSITYNLEENEIDQQDITFRYHLANLADAGVDIAVVKVPKSLDLFRLYMSEIAATAHKDTVVICGFMIKHFTKQMLEIASAYFEEVKQSLAWKKSRLITLSVPKATETAELIHEITYTDKKGTEHILKQYYGVFSAKHIDYATQFLLETLELYDSDKKILDLASGNGVIAYECRQQSKTAELHLLDDSHLAVASSKLNLDEQSTTFHLNDTMDKIEDSYFDLVLCNPPFHFGHENTIDIALSLFAGARRVLSPSGRFVCVANLHLNYKTHLEKLFSQVDSLASNEKFVVYQCWK